MSAEAGAEAQRPAGFRLQGPGDVPREEPTEVAAGPTTRHGRHLADRRIRVTRPRSRYIRSTGPGLVQANVEAVAPTAPIDQVVWRLRRLLFGRLLRTEEELGERLSKVKALATFSSDNLSSVAYATEAIMFTLLAAGTTAFWLVLPISGLIVGVFLIIVISYRQTIRAYPSGGGSYIVAKENLGVLPAVIAAGALLTDYVLTVSVSVAERLARRAIVIGFALLCSRGLRRWPR